MNEVQTNQEKNSETLTKLDTNIKDQQERTSPENKSKVKGIPKNPKANEKDFIVSRKKNKEKVLTN